MAYVCQITQWRPVHGRHSRAGTHPLEITESGGLVNQMVATLGLEKHPDKTFIGRIERGFDFLGYHFSRDGLTVATKTVDQFVARATQHYAQEPGTPQGVARLRVYVRRWIG